MSGISLCPVIERRFCNMVKSNSAIPSGRLIMITAIGGCIGLITFLIFVSISKGNNIVLCAALALLAGTLAITSSSSILFYSLYRDSHESIIKLKEQSSMDKLTELYNRSYLDPFLESEIDAAKKDNQQISVIMVDMDHFKEINDTYGHIVGDHVLTIFAQVVLKCIRKTDIIARYGGDEFIVVLPNTDTETAKSVAERIREDVSEAYIPPIDDVVISSIHCSVGISTYPIHCDSKNSLIKTSDLALYMAKKSGRNCTKVFQNDPVMN